MLQGGGTEGHPNKKKKDREKEPVSGREEGTLDPLIRLERDGGGRRKIEEGLGQRRNEGGGGQKILAWCPSKNLASYKVQSTESCKVDNFVRMGLLGKRVIYSMYLKIKSNQGHFIFSFKM